MVEISDSLRLLFETTIESERDKYTISIPKDLVENSSIAEDRPYRVALLPAADTPPSNDTQSESSTRRTESSTPQPDKTNRSAQRTRSQSQSPPVEEGEIRSVSIDTLGDQGDGIAKVERGFIVIVSGTQPGDEVDVEITDVKDSVAFAEPIGDPSVR